MMNKLNRIGYLFLIFLSFGTFAGEVPTSVRAANSIASVEPALKEALAAKGLQYGAPIFIRIFKDPGVLEVWLESSDGTFVNFKNYNICTFSGNLGPKLRDGDKQSREGFYYVSHRRLNPWSKFHLSLNLGYPNKYDQFHNRTGSALMVHGNCVSIGCYAMTDAYIDEIYALSVAALEAGQPFFRVHSFPFKLESERLSKYSASPWYSFWLNLKEGYDYFNDHKRPPDVDVFDGEYVFGP